MLIKSLGQSDLRLDLIQISKFLPILRNFTSCCFLIFLCDLKQVGKPLNDVLFPQSAADTSLAFGATRSG